MNSVDIPNSVTIIGDNAFYKCYCLTSLTIPNSVTTLGEYAFQHCTELTSIIIPNSVKYIGWDAFSDCANLSDVYCEAEKLSAEEEGLGLYADVDAFGSYWDLGPITLHVPEMSIEQYRTTEPWKYIRNIVALKDDDPKSDIKALKTGDVNLVDIYTIDGKRISHPQRGLNIIRMSDGSTKKVLVK